MKELVSIIIPIYNTKDFLKCCLNSVLRQTYKNLEIILIDDGSTDESGLICDAYATADSRIHVIHQKNGGLSNARNRGIDLATGDFIAFVDSDDYIHEQYIELLLNSCINGKCDVGIVNYHDVTSDNYHCTVPDSIPLEYVTNIQANLRIYDRRYYNRTITAWGKLFRRSLFQDIRFPAGKIHEDEATTYQLLYFSNKIVYIDIILYYYRRNANGITLSGFSEKKLNYLEALEERLTFYQQRHEAKLYELTLHRTYFEIVKYYNKTRQYIAHSEILQKKLRDRQKELYSILLHQRSFSIMRIFRYTWALLSPISYYKVSTRLRTYFIQKHNLQYEEKSKCTKA